MTPPPDHGKALYRPSRSWRLPGNLYVLLVSLLNTLLFNGALFGFLHDKLDLTTLSGLAIAASVFLVVFFFNLLVFSLLALVAPFLLRPFLVITALVNAVALHYMLSYQVVLDKAMIGNIFNTRTSEAAELISPSALVYLLILGVIPAWLFLRLRIGEPRRWRTLLQLLVAIPLVFGFLYLNAASWLWVDRYSKLLGGKILPWSYLINTARYYADSKGDSRDFHPLPDGHFRDNEKSVVVLVIGETARAQNFSLYGYPRPTNPLLEKDDLLVLPDATACTTYTRGSLACMLAHDPDATDDEPLPSYLTRMGAEVIWRTNNWGEPPIEVTAYEKRDELRAQCNGEGCGYDEVLLTGLAERIRASTRKKMLIVLHTKGSHGPSYYARYPSGFDRFEPVCRDEEISKCSRQALINAYDNTIVYTDHFLHETIELLKSVGDVPVVMMYLSDHGESLGENGLYLHGTPYMFAPDYQKKIPFLVWMSDAFKRRRGIDGAPPTDKTYYGHRNVFHTVLGALGLESPVYDPALDVLE